MAEEQVAAALPRSDHERAQARPALDDIEAALDDVAAILAQMG